jgi:hypothetical protein
VLFLVKTCQTIVSYFSKAFKAFVICCLVSWISGECMAQRLEIGAGGGVMHYKGDLAPELIPKFARPGATLFIRHNPGKAVSMKYSFSLGRIFADDRETDNNFANRRNRFFNTRITELAATAEYNFLDYRSDKARKPWSPYLFAGIAVFKFDPVENVRPDYDLTQLALPFGVGFKYVLGGQWNLGIEFGARKIFTDYLDDLGGDLNTTNKFQNGNPNDKDMYVFTTLSVSYTFYKIRCPNFY